MLIPDLTELVMPNHVNALVLPYKEHITANIVHSWKSYTSHEANKFLDRKKSFWMVEYYDRFIRNERHLDITREYIRKNPVAAGLVNKA